MGERKILTVIRFQTLTSAQLQDLLEQRMVVYNNLAAAQMKIDAIDAAMKCEEEEFAEIELRLT